jgi:hypothetical protein
VLLVVLIVATGMAALAVALDRLVHPRPVSLAWFPLAVALASIPLYVLRSAYERAGGLRGHSVSLVTQSVDSRNRAVVAATVALALSNTLHVPRVDALVGVAVALLILKTGIVLAADTVRAIRTGSEPILDRYSLWITDRFDAMIDTRIQTWLLHLVADEHLTNRQALLRQLEPALDNNRNPLVEPLGRDTNTPIPAQDLLNSLIDRGWLTGTTTLQLTPSGLRRLQRSQRRRY